MKKSVLFIFAVLALTACDRKNSYTLNGEIGSSTLDGKQVSVYSINDDPSSMALDSAIIENGSFKLHGNVDSAGWYILMIKDVYGSQPIMKDFYTEGKLDVALSGNQLRITGGPVNDVFQNFEDEYTKLAINVAKMNEKLQADPENAELKKSFEVAYKNFETEVRAIAIKTVKENIGNPAGIHILQGTISLMNEAEIESILKLGDEKFLQDPFVKTIASQLVMSKKVEIGQPFVDLALFSPQGDTVTLSNYVGTGKYVLIDFWASWCGPCIRELPNLLECYKAYHDKGFDIVGVSLDEKSEDWKNAISKHKLPWPQLSDLAGWNSIAVSTYSFSAIPHTVLVDPSGIIIEKDLRGNALKEKLETLFSDK